MAMLLYEKASKGDVTGCRVYRPYSPAKAGVIVHDYDKGTPVTHSRRVRVKWVNGEENDWTLAGLNDFDRLLEDHRKKLRTHEAMLERLKALCPETT